MDGGAAAGARLGVARAGAIRARPSTTSSTISRCWQGCSGRTASHEGHAHYMLTLNAFLHLSVIDRWSRSQVQWSPHDGIVRATDVTRPLLDERRLTRRAYSLSALQHYAACPYRFLLSAVYRLAPAEEPEPLQRMDPLTRGEPLPCDSDAVLPQPGGGRPPADSRLPPRCGTR